jgi:hypothetical protein
MISMSHHGFPNLREMLQGDLSKKLTEGIELMDFKVRECNCRRDKGVDKCQKGSICRVT